MAKYFLDKSSNLVRIDFEEIILLQSTNVTHEQELNIKKLIINTEDIIIHITPAIKNRDITVEKLIFRKPSVIYNESERIFKIGEIEFYTPSFHNIKVDVSSHFSISCVLYEILFDEPRITIVSNDEYDNHQKAVITIGQESIMDF